MIRGVFVWMLLVFVVCSFCGKDFKSVGRHSWRCKEKLHSDNSGNEQQIPNNSGMPNIDNDNAQSTTICNTSTIICCCGKTCKGLRGLKMHQRSCRVVHGLNDVPLEELSDTDRGNRTNNDVDLTLTEHMPNVKPGVKLPKSEFQWKLANEYFHAILPIAEIKSLDINTAIKQMNTAIYDYFKNNIGLTDEATQSSLLDKYKEMSKNELKSQLSKLKSTHAPLDEIKYVSKLLRSKLTKSNVSISNHDDKIQTNFWGYVKNTLNKSTHLSPSFDVSA